VCARGPLKFVLYDTEVVVLSRWPIRNKFRLGLAMLVVVVLALFGTACFGLYAYRGLVRSVSARSAELPLAGKVSRIVSDLRVTISEAQGRVRPQVYDYTMTLREAEPVDSLLLREEYRADFVSLQHAVSDYRDQLRSNRNRADAHIGDDRQERETLAEIERVVKQMKERELQRDWILDGVQLEAIQADALRLQQLADQLPAHMHARLHRLAHEVRSQYRTAIVAAWVSAAATLVLLILFVRMFRQWIARPLGTLIAASAVTALPTM